MRRNRGGAIARLLEDLGAGDPVAWGIVGLFVIVGTGIGLYVFKVHRDFRREDEVRARKYGSKG